LEREAGQLRATAEAQALALDRQTLAGLIEGEVADREQKSTEISVVTTPSEPNDGAPLRQCSGCCTHAADGQSGVATDVVDSKHGFPHARDVIDT
jgi:hypothetical protein